MLVLTAFGLVPGSALGLTAAESVEQRMAGSQRSADLEELPRECSRDATKARNRRRLLPRPVQPRLESARQTRLSSFSLAASSTGFERLQSRLYPERSPPQAGARGRPVRGSLRRQQDAGECRRA